jgi:FKBP-type peptidyl-prolyl cis-trans isomerase
MAAKPPCPVALSAGEAKTMRNRSWLLPLACLCLCTTGCGGDKVIKTDEGLKYVELQEGDGPAAKWGDTVEVVYTGWLKDGKMFDSNVGKDPYTVTIGKSKVIDGWKFGLLGMKAGGKRKLIIPPELGYGAEGNPPKIPRNAELYFDVEVIKIK